MAERTIKVGSAGKIFSLTGWKVGWLVAPPEMASVAARAHQFLTFATPPNLQAAVAFGLNDGDEWIAPMRARFTRARDRMTEGLRAAGYAVLDSASTYFMCVDLAASGIEQDDEAFAKRAVEQAGVAVVPLSPFAEADPARHLVRLCFAKRDETIDAGVAALKRAMEISKMSEARALLDELGVGGSVGDLVSHSPIDGSEIGRVRIANAADVAAVCEASADAFAAWRTVPAPRRGELVRLLGEELRAAKEPLARLVTLEAGKIVQEGLGEVQEMIDICDYAVGLSRQLYGLTIASERPDHRMIEQWHPLGPVAVISAFNFPVAVWAWNAALALGLRRSGDLEAEREDPADRRSGDGGDGTRARAVRRRAGWPCPTGPGRARRRRGAGRRSHASLWSRRPDRPRWGARSGRRWPSGSGAPCSNWAATMR